MVLADGAPEAQPAVQRRKGSIELEPFLSDSFFPEYAVVSERAQVTQPALCPFNICIELLAIEWIGFVPPMYP